jgi:hypothetical protein
MKQPILLTSLLASALLVSGCNSDKDTPVVHQTGDFDLVDVMQKAEPPKTEYNASVTFTTEYKPEFYEVYLYNRGTGEFSELESGLLQKNKKIDFTFQQYFDQKNLTLVFHLKNAGLPFLIAQPGEFVCFMDVKRDFFSETLPCNEKSTSLALVSTKEPISGFKDLLSPDKINGWRKLHSLGQTITLDLYTILISSLQTLIMEMPHQIEYKNRNELLLGKLSVIANELMNYISENHYLEGTYFDKQVANEFPAIDRTSFVLSTNGAKWVDRHNEEYLTSQNRRTLISQFLRGSKDLSFVDTQAFRVQRPSYNPQSKTVQWINWPWFKNVEIYVDDVSQGLVDGESFVLDQDDFDTVTFKPLGKLGKFQAIKMTKDSLEKSQVVRTDSDEVAQAEKD